MTLGHENATVLASITTHPHAYARTLTSAEKGFPFDLLNLSITLDPALVSPIDSLESIGTPIIAPLPDSPPDAIPGLLPRKGQLVLAGETNVGKAQPLDAHVLTSHGWKCMGQIEVGDTIINPYGGVSTVTHIFPQGLKHVYKITFSDGRCAEACAEHLWEVHHPNWQRHNSFKVLSTEEISKLSLPILKRMWIPTPEPVEFQNQSSLPIHPWVLGVMLGDGHLPGMQITSADPELIAKLASLVPAEIEVRKLAGKFNHSLVTIGGITRKGFCGSLPNVLKESLRSLNLLGCLSHEKFIPNIYLHASISERKQLLSGLMDTDGYVTKGGQLSFSTSSRELAENVTYLIRSLGGVCSIRSKMAGYKKNGVRKETRLSYTCQISYSNPKELVSLPRKMTRLNSTMRNRRLRVKSIKLSRMTQTQCIKVDSPRGLYITDDFVVTHNTLIALEICSTLSTGIPLWSSLVPTIQARRILYVLGEHYNEVIQRLWQHTQLPMSDQVWIVGPEQLGYDKWLVANGKPNPHAIDKFQKWGEGVDLIVFDPLSAFVTGVDTENDNVQMRLALDTMSLIAQLSDASCLVLAHQGKPMLDKTGQERARKSYAIRGASAIEDAATNIFYMSKVAGNEDMRLPPDSSVISLVCRKYKGIAPPEYRLLRDPVNLTHTTLGDKPFFEIHRIDTQAKVARVQNAIPGMPFSDAVKIVAAMQGQSEQTILRYLK